MYKVNFFTTDGTHRSYYEFHSTFEGAIELATYMTETPEVAANIFEQAIPNPKTGLLENKRIAYSWQGMVVMT